MKKYLLFCALVFGCSTDEHCPPGTIIKLGKCFEAYENMETGDFEDDPPLEPDPYDNTPEWVCSDYLQQENFHFADIDVIEDVFPTSFHKGDVEFCPINPIHHFGDPWPAKPYSPEVSELPHVPFLWSGLDGDPERSRQIANFGIYLGLVPTAHPRAPLYSPIFWQLGASPAQRARYNIIGSPCIPGNSLIPEDLDYFAIDCLRAVDEWGVQAEWPSFPSVTSDQEWDRDRSAEMAVCLGNPSGSYVFTTQAVESVGHPDLKGLTYLNAAFLDEFMTDLFTGKILQELGELGFVWIENGEMFSDTLDEMLAWMDHALSLAYLPNCDPNDANDDIAPSVHCAAWSNTGICSNGVEVRWHWEPIEGGPGWYTTLSCPTPYVGILPPMDLDLEIENGVILPGQETVYRGWCQPSHTMWTPDGSATPPPGGAHLDIIQLPLEETGYYRGYLINTDNFTLDTLQKWYSLIQLTPSKEGIIISLNKRNLGGRELLSQLGLQAGDVITAIGHTDFKGASVDSLLTLLNDYMNEGRVINAYVRRGEMMLPTYIMRASYRASQR